VARLVKIDGAGLCGLQVAGTLAFKDGEIVESAGVKRVNGYAVQGYDVVVGARDDLDIVANPVSGAGHYKVPAPRAQGHGLLKYVVEAVARVGGDTGDGVAVEDGDALTAARMDAGSAEVDGTLGDALRPELEGLAGVHRDGEESVGRMAPQGVHGGRDVDFGVVFGGHDEESRGFVVPRKGGAGSFRLVAALDDVFVAEAFDGQHEGGVERHIGDVGAIHRDGVVGGHLDAFLEDALVLATAVVPLFARYLDGGDVVGADAEALRPARKRVRNGARAVAFGADEHLVDDPAARGMVLEAVVHEREPELLALRRGVLRKRRGQGEKVGDEQEQKSSDLFHVGAFFFVFYDYDH